MNSRASQADSLLAYLLKHPEGIDRKTAEEELGICSLSRRICDLQDQGRGIKKRWRKLLSRYSRATQIAVYSLDIARTRKAPATQAADRPPDKDSKADPAPSTTKSKAFGPPTEDRKGNALLF